MHFTQGGSKSGYSKIFMESIVIISYQQTWTTLSWLNEVEASIVLWEILFVEQSILESSCDLQDVLHLIPCNQMSLVKLKEWQTKLWETWGFYWCSQANEARIKEMGGDGGGPNSVLMACLSPFLIVHKCISTLIRMSSLRVYIPLGSHH